MTNKINYLAFSTGLVLSAGATPTVLAQSGGFVLEETVVTARKVEESLQDAPLAVSAYTDDAMEIRNATDVLDIGALSPNME